MLPGLFCTTAAPTLDLRTFPLQIRGTNALPSYQLQNYWRPISHAYDLQSQASLLMNHATCGDKSGDVFVREAQARFPLTYRWGCCFELRFINSCNAEGVQLLMALVGHHMEPVEHHRWRWLGSMISHRKNSSLHDTCILILLLVNSRCPWI